MQTTSGPDNNAADEKQPLIADDKHSTPESESAEMLENGDEDDIEIEAMPMVSMYSLKSSQKIESTAERGALTFLKNLIGTGILALPYVIQQVGLIPAWILIITLGMLNFYSMNLLNKVANALKVKKIDHGRLCEKVTESKFLRYLADINIYILQLGGCLPGVIFILEYLEKITCLYEWEAFCDVKFMQILLILIFVLPIGAITDLHYLSIPSGIAILVQFFFYLVFVVICGIKIYQNGIAAGSFTAYDLSNLPIAFASILFAYEGIGLLLELRASVPNKKEFKKVMRYSLFFSTLAYFLFGTFGKLAFGADVEAVVFLNLDQSNNFLVILEFAYLLALTTALPAAVFPPLRVIENWGIFKTWLLDPETGMKSKWKRQLIRQPLFIMIVLAAAIAPSFNIVISLLGGSNFTVLSFVIPVILYNTKFKGDPKKRWYRLFNWVILVVGVILGSIATYQSILDIYAATTTTTTA